MHASLSLLALILAVVLCAAAQSITIFPPSVIVECKETTFTWSGGNAPYSFHYGPGHKGIGDDSGVETEYGWDGIFGNSFTFDAPHPEGLPWRFRVADGTQSASIWMNIQPSSCIPTYSSPPPQTSTQPPHTSTTQTFFTSTTRTTYTSPPGTSSPYSSTTTNGYPGSTGTHPTPTEGISTTTKQTSIPPNPTANPSNPDPDAPPGLSVPSGNTSGGTGGPGDGSPSSGDTRTMSNQPTGSHGDSDGGNPTQTASPIRSTQSDDDAPMPMSAQARGAIIGTLTGAFVLFISFLCFRWRRRHQKKHRPVPILPRVGNSGEDITTAVIPPYEYSPPMRTNENLPVGMFSLPLRPVPSPPRVLPSSKQAMAMAPRRSSSEFGSEASSPISAGTWRSEREETSRAGSVSAYPEDEIPPPPLGHSPTTNSSHERYLRPPAPSSMPSPLSLQQLIGRELDNILSNPETYSPDTPLYTPTSTSALDHTGRFRVANDTEPSSSSAGGVASTSKHPHALTEESSSQKGERARRSPDLGSTDSRAGGQRQRVPISRNEMEYLADLVAARITRDGNQATEQIPSETSRHGPPPSYV